VTADPPVNTLRQRGLSESGELFPRLTFGVALRDQSVSRYVRTTTRLNLTLGLLASALLLFGLWLTWRATMREVSVAQMKSDFLASVSHELKTPLTAIRAFGDLIRSGRTRDGERIRKYGERITAESERLTGLLNNILW